jgi:hypothetical protein
VEIAASEFCEAGVRKSMDENSFGLAVLAIAAASLGACGLWGAGIGALTFGVLLLLLAVSA